MSNVDYRLLLRFRLGARAAALNLSDECAQFSTSAAVAKYRESQSYREALDVGHRALEAAAQKVSELRALYFPGSER